MNIAITLTSSLQVGQEYIDVTRQVAERLAKDGHGVVYGGTAYGMMLELAEAYKNAGGQRLIGVMSKDLMAVTKGYKAYEGLDEQYVEETYSTRKDKICSTANAVLALPGGYGTLDEMVTYITSKVNKLYDVPIALYNHHGFYDTFIKFCEELVGKDFSKIGLSDVVFVSDNLDDILDYFNSYKPAELADKFV